MREYDEDLVNHFKDKGPWAVVLIRSTPEGLTRSVCDFCGNKSFIAGLRLLQKADVLENYLDEDAKYLTGCLECNAAELLAGHEAISKAKTGMWLETAGLLPPEVEQNAQEKADETFGRIFMTTPANPDSPAGVREKIKKALDTPRNRRTRRGQFRAAELLKPTTPPPGTVADGVAALRYVMLAENKIKNHGLGSWKVPPLLIKHYREEGWLTPRQVGVLKQFTKGGQ